MSRFHQSVSESLVGAGVCRRRQPQSVIDTREQNSVEPHVVSLRGRPLDQVCCGPGLTEPRHCVADGEDLGGIPGQDRIADHGLSMVRSHQQGRNLLGPFGVRGVDEVVETLGERATDRR